MYQETAEELAKVVDEVEGLQQAFKDAGVELPPSIMHPEDYAIDDLPVGDPGADDGMSPLSASSSGLPASMSRNQKSRGSSARSDSILLCFPSL